MRNRIATQVNELTITEYKNYPIAKLTRLLHVKFKTKYFSSSFALQHLVDEIFQFEFFVLSANYVTLCMMSWC